MSLWVLGQILTRPYTRKGTPGTEERVCDEGNGDDKIKKGYEYPDMVGENHTQKDCLVRYTVCVVPAVLIEVVKSVQSGNQRRRS